MAATANTPRLTLVRTRAAISAPTDPRPADSPVELEAEQQEESAEQQDAEALRVHRLVGEHAEGREGDDHRDDAEAEAAGQPLRGDPGQQAGRDPDHAR